MGLADNVTINLTAWGKSIFFIGLVGMGIGSIEYLFMGLLIITQDYRRRKQFFLISDAEKFSPFFGKNSPLAILVEKESRGSFRRLEICYSHKSLLRRTLCEFA
jgi:hypothetical protein